MGRAQRLTTDINPLEFHAFITEQALRTRVGSVEIMRAQWQHLIKLADRATIKVRVVVPEAGPHSAGNGQFLILEFDKARSIAYDEKQDGAVYVQNPGEVDTYKGSIESLEAVALSEDDSVSFIEDLIKRY
jgi:hypothetical protein